MNTPTFIDPASKPEQQRDGFSYVRLIDHIALGTNFNTLLVSCITEHPPRRVLQGIRMYFVVRGHGEFIIGDISYPVAEDQQVLIRAGETYQYSGEMTLLECNVNIGPGELHEDLE